MEGATLEMEKQESLGGAILCWKNGISSNRATFIRYQAYSQTCESHFVPAHEPQHFTETQMKPRNMLLCISQCKTSSPDSYRSIWGYKVYTKLSSRFSFQLMWCCPFSCQHWQYPPHLECMLSLSCTGTTDSIAYHQNSLSERKWLHSKHLQDLGSDHCHHCSKQLMMSCSSSDSSFCSRWALVGRRERAAALPREEILAVVGAVCSMMSFTNPVGDGNCCPSYTWCLWKAAIE